MRRRRKLLVVHKGIQPLAAELTFDLTEHRFDWVELRRVPNVEDPCDVEPLPVRLHILALMHLQLVTEYAQRLPSMFLPQLLEMGDEGATVDCLVVDVKPL